MELKVPVKEALGLLSKSIKSSDELLKNINEYYDLIPAKIRIDEQESIELFQRKKEKERIRKEVEQEIEEANILRIKLADEKSEKAYQEALKKRGPSPFPVIDWAMQVIRNFRKGEKERAKMMANALKSIEHIKINPYNEFISQEEEDGSFDIDTKDKYFGIINKKRVLF